MNSTAQVTAVIALIVALIAMVLGWVAFNRSGADIEEIVRQQIDEATVGINADLDRLEETFRQNSAEELRQAAEDVEDDQAPEEAGE